MFIETFYFNNKHIVYSTTCIVFSLYLIWIIKITRIIFEIFSSQVALCSSRAAFQFPQSPKQVALPWTNARSPDCCRRYLHSGIRHCQCDYEGCTRDSAQLSWWWLLSHCDNCEGPCLCLPSDPSSSGLYTRPMLGTFVQHYWRGPPRISPSL